MKKVYWIDEDARVQEWYFVSREDKRVILKLDTQVKSLPETHVYVIKKLALADALVQASGKIAIATQRLKAIMEQLNTEQTAERDRPSTDRTI